MLSTHLKEMNNTNGEIKIWNQIMHEVIIRRERNKKINLEEYISSMNIKTVYLWQMKQHNNSMKTLCKYQ